jgi:hypothetical protein
MKITEEKAAQLANGEKTEPTTDQKAEMLQQMDADAKRAFEELNKLDQGAVKLVAKWYAVWYLKAGHKRLGRGLAKLGK